MPKRKCVFSDSLKSDFPFIRETSFNDKVECTICHSVISIAHGGRSDIKDHINKKKHKDALSASTSSSKVSTFFKNASLGTSELQLAAEEGTFAYHSVFHNHSFRSMDCTSSVIRKLFERPKFSCAKTKCEAIVVNVPSSYALERFAGNLNSAKYISVLTIKQ